MDKADFIRIAPAYYELALILEVMQRDGYFSEIALQTAFEVTDETGDDYSLLHNRMLLRGAIANLVEHKAIGVIFDPFGPALYARGEGFAQYTERLYEDRESPFYKSSLADNRRAWVFTALSNVSEKYRELDISEEDFAVPADAEWAPIPIDRGSEAFTKAEAAVNKTITEVENSNGYNAQHPEERASVLDNLKALQERLRTAKEISVAYVKAHGIEALKKLSARFGNAAIGRLADAAINALLVFLGLK